MNDETKTFLVELFDVKLAENKKEIIKEITESFDAKLAQNRKEITESFDAKLAQNRKEITESFDAKLAQNRKEMTELFDQKCAEQNKLFDTKFDDLTFQVTQVVGEILDVVNNKFERERKKTDKKINKKIAML